MNIKPQLWVFAGPNGSGKSTMINKFVGGRISIINPDIIARQISVYYYNINDLQKRIGGVVYEEHRSDRIITGRI